MFAGGIPNNYFCRPTLRFNSIYFKWNYPLYAHLLYAPDFALQLCASLLYTSYFYASYFPHTLLSTLYASTFCAPYNLRSHTLHPHTLRAYSLRLTHCAPYFTFQNFAILKNSIIELHRCIPLM